MAHVIKIIFVSLSLFGCLYSQEVLTLYQVINIAKQKNPRLKELEVELENVRLKIKNIESEFYPDLSFSASPSKNILEDYKEDIHYSYSLSAGLPVFTGFSRIYRFSSQILDLQITQENYRRTLSDIISNIKKSYVDLYYSQELISLLEKILQRRKQNYELVKLKYESGREDIGSLLRVEADMLQAEYDLNRAKRTLENTIWTLLKYMGEDNFRIIYATSSFKLSSKNIDDLVNIDNLSLISVTPEYKIKKLQLKKAQLQAKISKSAFYPTVSASAVLGLSDTKVIPDTTKWNLSVTMRLSYTLFNGFKNFNDLKIANNNIKTVEFELYDTRLNLLSTINSLKNNFIDNKSLLKVKQKYLEAVEKQAEIIAVKYMNGLATYYDWYQTEDSYINIQKSLLEIKRLVAISEINLENFLGYCE